MNIKMSFVALVLWLACSATSSHAESLYNQPYLGVWPAWYRDQYSAEAFNERASDNLAAVAAQSDLIIVGEAETITATSVPLHPDRIEFYHADVKPLRTLKGKTAETSFHLKFQPSATDLDKGAQHVFFLKKVNGGFQVLKACYLSPRGGGYTQFIRVVGAYDCDAELGLDTIQYLLDHKGSTALEARLMTAYKGENYMNMYSAVYLAASAAPGAGNEVLKRVVSMETDRHLDLQLYGMAVYALARQQKVELWRFLLENIPAEGRIPESIVFDLAATYGDSKVVPVIKDVVARKPDLTVSAAYALSRIGGQEARDAIASWLADEQRHPDAPAGLFSIRSKKSDAALLQQALEQVGKH